MILCGFCFIIEFRFYIRYEVLLVWVRGGYIFIGSVFLDEDRYIYRVCLGVVFKDGFFGCRFEKGLELNFLGV